MFYMHLTRKQRRQVEKLSETKNPQEIARILNVSEEAVINFLPKNLNRTAVQSSSLNKIQEFALKTWLKENYLILILLAVLIFTSYLNGLNNDFLSDDLPTIAHNIGIGTWKFVFARPFVFLRGFLYFFIYNVAGRSPAPFRFSNILFHIGVTWVFFFLISRTISKKIAIFSSIIFAIHPIISETITWVSGGYYPQYGFFLLLSMAFYLISKKIDKWYFFSLLSFLLALFSSERTAMFPLIIFVWEICSGDIKENWKRVIPFFFLSGVWGLFFILGLAKYRIHELKTDYYQTKTIQNPLFQIPAAISSYFELIFWPNKLTLYHSELIYSKMEFILRAIVTLSYFGSLVYFFKKNKIVFFWLSFFFISLLPYITPLGISWTVAERYVYLGSMGIFITFGVLLEKLLAKYKSEKLFYVILAILILPLTIRTIVRNIDWKDQDHLWLAAARTSPSSPQNHNNLGDLYSRHKDLPKAVEEFQTAIKLLPNYADAYHNLANTFVQMGKIDLAAENYKKAILFNPNLWQSHQNLGSIYFQQELLSQAEEEFKKGILINPQESLLHYGLGVIYLRQQKTAEAKDELQISLQLNPENKAAQEELQKIGNPP